jgi:Fumarate hydratase (Fumerase)
MVSEGDVVNATVELLRKTVVKLPKDVEDAIRKAYASETDEVPKMQFKAIVENIDMALRTTTPMCQDTGVTIFYAALPSRRPRRRFRSGRTPCTRSPGRTLETTSVRRCPTSTGAYMTRTTSR